MNFGLELYCIGSGEERLEDIQSEIERREWKEKMECLELKKENKTLRGLNIKVQEKVIELLEPIQYQKVLKRYTLYIKSANIIQKYWRHH